MMAIIIPLGNCVVHGPATGLSVLSSCSFSIPNEMKSLLVEFCE